MLAVWLLLITLRISDEDPRLVSSPAVWGPGVPFPTLELSEVDAVILNVDSTQPTAKSLTHEERIPDDIQRLTGNPHESGSLDID